VHVSCLRVVYAAHVPVYIYLARWPFRPHHPRHLMMRANNNLRHHNIHTLGLAEPVLPCLAPDCIRRFYNRSGRSSHMRSQHPELVPKLIELGDRSPPHSPLSHQGSSSNDGCLSSQSGACSMPDPPPVGSRSPSRAGYEAEMGQGDIEMTFDPPQNSFDDAGHHTGSDRGFSSSPNQDSSHIASNDHASAHLTRIYHPTINGTFSTKLS
jgi:hypothetical protein